MPVLKLEQTIRHELATNPLLEEMEETDAEQETPDADSESEFDVAESNDDKTDDSFDWDQYLKAAGAPSFEALNVAVPDFVTGLNEVIEQSSLEDLKTYLRWHVVRDASPLLSSAFVDQDF